MLANDMKKGQTGTLRGTRWRFRIEDNKKGNIRMATVYGLFTEMGSIYVKDILTVDVPSGPDGKEVAQPLELSPSQIKAAALIKAAGF